MSEQLKPTVHTPFTMAEFARCLLLIWPEGGKKQAGVLWAHFAGETGDGAHCYGWNLGNVKHVRGDGHDYHLLAGVWEGVAASKAKTLIDSGFWTLDPDQSHQKAVGPGKVSVVASANNPARWFRNYPDEVAGMRAHVDGKRRGRYASAWQYVESGDPQAYGRELGAKGYYTASPDVYAHSMQVKHDAWMASDAFDLALRAFAFTPKGEESDHELVDGPAFDIVHTIPMSMRCAKCGMMSCIGDCNG